MVINIKKGNYMKTKNLFKKKLKGQLRELNLSRQPDDYVRKIKKRV